MRWAPRLPGPSRAPPTWRASRLGFRSPGRGRNPEQRVRKNAGQIGGEQEHLLVPVAAGGAPGEVLLHGVPVFGVQNAPRQRRDPGSDGLAVLRCRVCDVEPEIGPAQTFARAVCERRRGVGRGLERRRQPARRLPLHVAAPQHLLPARRQRLVRLADHRMGGAQVPRVVQRAGVFATGCRAGPVPVGGQPAHHGAQVRGELTAGIAPFP